MRARLLHVPGPASLGLGAGMSKTFTVEEVARHNKVDDLYVIIDSNVYDLTKFLDLHPGGGAILKRHAGESSN